MLMSLLVGSDDKGVRDAGDVRLMGFPETGLVWRDDVA